MRKVTVVTIVVALVLTVGGWIFLNGVPFGNSARRLVVDLSLDFMEDLQFKDFRRSASYHHKLEKHRVDIGRTLEKLFLVKPESLDLREFHIVKAEVDSTGDRARVHIRTKFQRLNMKDEPENGELILYWMKRNPDCPIDAVCSAEKLCTNTEGDVLVRLRRKKNPDDWSEPKRESEVTERQREDYEVQQFACTPGAEPKWFMNLDSTLKEKRYNY